MKVFAWIVLAVVAMIILALIFYLVVGAIIFKFTFARKNKNGRASKKNVDKQGRSEYNNTSNNQLPKPKWRNWQTQRTQNPPPSKACGFESHLRQ